MWSTAQRLKKIDGFDVHAWFEGNYGSVGYGKHCALELSCVEEGGWSCVEGKGLSCVEEGLLTCL